jgi:gliding motility-associated protein GldM
MQSQASEGNAGAKAALAHFKKVHDASDKLITKIKEIKTELEKRTEGRKKTEDGGELVKGGVNELMMGDNMEVHANYFVVENGGQRGKDIQKIINDTRKEMLEAIDDAIKDPVLSASPTTKTFLTTKKNTIAAKTSLSAEDGKNSDGSPESWVAMYLEHSPLAGVFALLSKIENDAKSMEAEVAQALAESVGANAIKFDSVIPVIRAQTSAVLTGQTYEADIILAAYDSRSNMTMTVNGSPIEVKDGMGKYKASSSSPGEYSFEIGINVPKPQGGFEQKTDKGKYSVFAPSAAISADELNVLYVGLDNPLSITVAGVDPRNVNVSVNTAEVQLVSKGGGHYLAKLPARKGGDCIISVTAKVGDRVVPMGTKKFKLRNVPRPAFQAGPIDFSQPVRLTELAVQSRALAVLENFIYESVSYSITGYKFIYLSKTKGYGEIPVNGNSLVPIQNILKTLRPGDFVSFTEIKAVGPGGIVKPLPAVSSPLK